MILFVFVLLFPLKAAYPFVEAFEALADLGPQLFLLQNIVFVKLSSGLRLKGFQGLQRLIYSRQVLRVIGGT